MTRVVRRVFLCVASVVCVVVTLLNLRSFTIDVDGTFYLIDEYVDTYYEMLSDNVGLTTPNGISNVLVNMKSDGYDIHSIDVTDTYVDVSFTKDDNPSYRFYYEHPSGRITFFSSDYETSYTGVSYINERKEKSAGQ